MIDRMNSTRFNLNKTAKYVNAVLGILLLAAVCAGLRPDILLQGGVQWIVYVLVLFVLIGYCDGLRVAGRQIVVGRHLLKGALFILGIELLTAFVEYSQSEDASLTMLGAYLRAHAGRLYTHGGLVAGAVLMYVLGAVICGVWCVWRQRTGAATDLDVDAATAADTDRDDANDGIEDGAIGAGRSHGIIGLFHLLIGTLAFLGRHPFVVLALYRIHQYYEFLWGESNNEQVGIVLQCLLLPILLCIILRIMEFYGCQMEMADAQILRAIGDVYRKYWHAANVAFYVVASAVFAIVIVGATMFRRFYAREHYNVAFMIVCIALLLVTSLRLWNDKSHRCMAIQWCILFTGVMTWYLCDSTVILILCMMIIATEGMSARRIMQIYLITSVVILTAAAWASVNGYINYYSYNGLHAMGIYYRTDYATYWLYIVMIYRVLRDKRMRLIEYVIAAILMAYVNHLTESRTTLLCVTLFLGACYLMDYWPEGLRIRCLTRWLYRIGYLIYPLCAMLTYIIVAVWGAQFTEGLSDTGSFWFTMKYRVALSYIGFTEYPLRILAQAMNKKDIGSFDYTTNTYYFTLDNSYVRYVINYGILFLLILLGICVYLIHRCGREQNMLLLCALAVIAIHSLSEPHLANLYHNVFLVLVFAIWDMRGGQELESVSDEATLANQ